MTKRKLRPHQAVVRQRNQVTLPPDIVAHLGLASGDAVQFNVQRDGSIRLYPLRLYLLEPAAVAEPTVDQVLEAAAAGVDFFALGYEIAASGDASRAPDLDTLSAAELDEFTAGLTAGTPAAASPQW